MKVLETFIVRRQSRWSIQQVRTELGEAMVMVREQVTMSSGIVERCDLYDEYRNEAAGRGTLDDAMRMHFCMQRDQHPG